MEEPEKKPKPADIYIRGMGSISQALFIMIILSDTGIIKSAGAKFIVYMFIYLCSMYL